MKKQTLSGLAALIVAVLAYFLQPHEKTRDEHAAARGRYEGVCVNVLDGDTIDVKADSGETFRVRFLGMDCMETFNRDKMAEQARRLGRSEAEIERLGQRAKSRVNKLVLHQHLEWVVPEGTPLFDPYDRMLVYVEFNGKDLGEQLLSEGLAELRHDKHPRSARYRAAAVALVK